jgi:hypothetical protein
LDTNKIDQIVYIITEVSSEIECRTIKFIHRVIISAIKLTIQVAMAML